MTRSSSAFLPIAPRSSKALAAMTATMCLRRSGVVLLLFSGKTFAFVKDKAFLCCGLVLLGLGDRRYEFGPAPLVDDLLRRLSRFVEIALGFRSEQAFESVP
jgi:hypothetical protein